MIPLVYLWYRTKLCLTKYRYPIPRHSNWEASRFYDTSDSRSPSDTDSCTPWKYKSPKNFGQLFIWCTRPYHSRQTHLDSSSRAKISDRWIWSRIARGLRSCRCWSISVESRSTRMDPVYKVRHFKRIWLVIDFCGRELDPLRGYVTTQ